MRVAQMGQLTTHVSRCCKHFFTVIWPKRAVPNPRMRALHLLEGERTMDDMFDEVLAICLDRVSDGDDIESCVADYPECPDLQPLLELAAALTVASDDGGSREKREPTWLAPRPRERRLRPT